MASVNTNMEKLKSWQNKCKIGCEVGSTSLWFKGFQVAGGVWILILGHGNLKFCVKETAVLPQLPCSELAAVGVRVLSRESK